MAFKLTFTESYTKRAIKFARKHPELKQQYLKTLQLLELNPHHPSLRLHKLQGKLDMLHAISINLSYRMTIEMLIEDEEVILINIGTHDEVYR
ncbi:MAG: plasmid stabilization protein [Ghiorsea sp.]|nr:plasmid stabilization protein [Ghiorsea sp.]